MKQVRFKDLKMPDAPKGNYRRLAPIVYFIEGKPNYPFHDKPKTKLAEIAEPVVIKSSSRCVIL